MKLSELIERLGGMLANGSPDHRLRGVNSTTLAGVGDIVFAEDAKSVREALESKAGVVVLRAGIADKYPSGKCVVETPQPRLWFARAGKLLKPALPVTGVHPSAVIGSGVKLGDDVTIGACAVVEDKAQIGARTRIDAGAVIGRGVRVGEYCRIYPRAVLYPGTTLGNWVVVHAGAVLGADLRQAGDRLDGLGPLPVESRGDESGLVERLAPADRDGPADGLDLDDVPVGTELRHGVSFLVICGS